MTWHACSCFSTNISSVYVDFVLIWLLALLLRNAFQSLTYTSICSQMTLSKTEVVYGQKSSYLLLKRGNLYHLPPKTSLCSRLSRVSGTPLKEAIFCYRPIFLNPSTWFNSSNVGHVSTAIVIFLEFPSTKQGQPLADSWSHGLN